MSTIIYLLKASEGDCFFVRDIDDEGNETLILIDGGTARTYQTAIKTFIDNQNIKKIDLVVLTHSDGDHIQGLVSFFSSELIKSINIKEYWANCKDQLKLDKVPKISFAQVDSFNNEIIKNESSSVHNKWKDNILFQSDIINIKIGSVDILVLSPSEWECKIYKEKWNASIENISVPASNVSTSQLEKGSIEELGKQEFSPQKTLENDFVNASSIAFLLRTSKMSILFLADSRPEVIIKTLSELGYSDKNRLCVDFVKISHHGSKNNTSIGLLNMIKCKNFIISTHGGVGKSKHPDREVIARILSRNKDEGEETNLYFNYPLSEIESRAGKFIMDEECVKNNCRIYDNQSEIKYE
ncbi:ComEC/Rec2 family competence protein [Sphingobacterium endophyticum]|uniref:ComEC/Rec2 family competence protein n=1 Tax=Sphingobacterium endophyticum TaxID=2546448 RepID=UPI0012E277D0|nr:MBL fold metallo-hydrolase [Sphingobacterium endophyticum]